MIENIRYYVLVEKENGLFLNLFDENKNMVDNFFSLNENKINNYIIEYQNKKAFFISWDKFDEDKNSLKVEEDLLELLLESSDWVDVNFEKVTIVGLKNITLVARNNPKNNDSIDIFFEIDDNIISKNNIVGNYIYFKGCFYELNIIKNTLFSVKDIFENIDKYDLESYFTLILKNYKNINIRYEDYDTVNMTPKKTIPQIIIEKVSFDNSLYLKFDSIVSTMDYLFFEKNKIEKVATINEIEKKVEISDLSLETLKSSMQEFVKVITQLQKKAGLKSSFYIDTENFIILNEDLAKEFVRKELLQLVSRYSVIGTDKLKKYNIKAVKPKIFGSFKYGINYFEGEVKVEIEGEKISIQELFNKYNKDEYIVLTDGTNALVNKEYMKKLQKLFKDEDDKIKVSFFDLPLVEELFENITFEKENSNELFFKGINEISYNEKDIPKLNISLRDYQKYGYNWLKYITDNNLGACLADDMGLGKTIQAIALITKLHEKKKKKTLVVMPKSLIFNWENEIKKFAPFLKVGIHYGLNREFKNLKSAEVILTTYGTVRNDIESLMKEKFDLIVLDESQNIKNVNSQTTKAILLLNAPKRVALSGTPIENNLLELYSLFRFLNPSMFGSIHEFQQNYIQPIQTFSDKSSIKELRKKIYPFILRRVKKEVLEDLPDKIEKLLYIDMSDEHRKIYEEKRKHFYSLLESNKNKNGEFDSFFIIQAINELRHIISSPEYINKKVFSEKKEILVNNVTEAVKNGHKVLIFVNYLSSVDSICSSLTKNNIKFLKMTGEVKNRQELVEKFQTDNRYKAFVMTLKTGGVGLNLVAADTIFIYDPWWNKTVENQAIDRAYRLGQDKTVFAYKMIMRNTIEEKILKLQEMKSKLLDELISEDNLYTKHLTQSDIEFILGNN